MYTSRIKKRLAVSCTAVVVLTTAGSIAYAATHDNPENQSGVSAELRTDTGASAWWANGRFIVKSESGATGDWKLQFDLSAGTYQNNRPDIVDAKQEGKRVTLTPKGEGGKAQTWGTEIGFGLSGDGKQVPKVEGCSINGTDVKGCSSGDETPEPTPTPTDPETPAGPTAPENDRSFAMDHASIHVMWKRSEPSASIKEYEVYKDGALAVTRAGNLSPMVNILDLKPDTAYKFKVRAKDNAGKFADSAEFEVRTLAESKPDDPTTPPPPPGNGDSPADFKVNQSSYSDAGRTLRNLDVEWKQQAGVERFEVQVNGKTTTLYFAPDAFDKSGLVRQPLPIGEAKSGASFKVKVRAWVNGHWSDFTNEQTVTIR
ncbi:fibronectin type III domain-containing protein [Streptomyces pathocidini]|uniref:Fibronectin type III domain-containing protein n=1 Tax=Streptomyces pathocidini TaxID=1650571 RepID=A0ABW7UUZ9_9ACTN|nr:fibronectin type III domain-containing protein [Streptomyces pathocidini]